ALAEGSVRVWTNPGGAEIWTTQVASMTGTFTYRIHIPAGALLGDHLLESELAWEEADEVGAFLTQRARQFTILPVEDTDAPDDEPVYFLVLDVWGGDWRSDGG
ncbi:MAG TPA: hypothetical protein VI997_05970, partial [Candidatus Thermoplasmatota archaeon]|nr:hypothetical protein [Candidatus Thermoplasmatota archaeon]